MSSSYTQTRDAASSGALHATGAAVGSYGAYKAGKAAGKKVNKQALSNAAKRAAEARSKGINKISSASEKALAKARSAGRGANSSRVQQTASQKLKELGVDSPKTSSGRDKSYGSRGLSKSQQATLDAGRAANADKVGKEAAKQGAKKGAAKGAASIAGKAALPVGVALTAYDVYQAGRRGAGKNDISKTTTHQYGKGGDANYYAPEPVATPGGKNKEHIKKVAQRWLPKEAAGGKKAIVGYNSSTGKPIYGTKRNDTSASVQDSKAMKEYRHKRRTTGAYKGNFYGPDQFKGDMERLKDWRKAGSPKDVEGWLASQANKKKIDNKWVSPDKPRSSYNKSRSSTPTRTDYSTGYGVQR